MLDYNKKSSSKTSEVLCFDKNEFMTANFSVDEFLHKNRNVPSLEQLRDNLGLYLKGLRSSMIDLINEDYADFVSLSANLVGLDDTIEIIKQPLVKFHDEVDIIRSLVKENEEEIRAQLERKQQLWELKRNLQCLKKVYDTIEKLEELMVKKLSNSLNTVDLERAAVELIQLKFNKKFCSSFLKEEQKQNIFRLQDEVLQKLRMLFVDSLKTASSKCSEQLERCLRIYITLDACHVAETVFREDVVAPYLSTVISEYSLQNSPQGLAGVYSKSLNFISLNMTDLLRLTQYTDKVRGFNFLVNSFWAEVEMRLETHMSSIFAPGNSEIFYAKYKCTRDFISKIKNLLASETEIKNFNEHKLTQSFQARWNLPVYFQICFQEIVGNFEAILEPIVRDDLINNSNDNGDFQINSFNIAQTAIKRCWSEGVYLEEVFPKFFKLNIQIVIRLSRWISDVLHVIDNSSKIELPSKLSKKKFLIILHTDIQKMNAKLTDMHKTVLENIPNDKKSTLVLDAISKSFGELDQMLLAHLCNIQKSLVDRLIIDSGADNIRQVNDLPRLYRKTNREVPSRCSGYVEQMLRPLKQFADEQNTLLGEDIVEDILAQVLSKITTDYYAAVSNVLTSVQKTEESLRRLRNLKQQSANTAATNLMSDDDKIRLQLRVDVNAWTDELDKLNFTPAQIEKLLDLRNIVEESMKPKE